MVMAVNKTAKPAVKAALRAARTRSGQISKSEPSQFSWAGFGLPFSSPFRVEAEAAKSILIGWEEVEALCKKMVSALDL